MTTFADNTPNITEGLSETQLKAGFAGCAGDGALPMTSANFNAVLKWLSNINWDGIPFTDLAEFEGKNFPIQPLGAIASGDVVYMRRGNRVYKVPMNAGNVPFNDDNWFLSTPAENVQQALDQLSDFLAQAFGDDLVILNNPTFYIRQGSGSANPPIETQSDLTVANAFNSFEAMRIFISRTYIVGNVTIDARGTFDAENEPLTISSSYLKNAGTVVLQGDPNNVGALRFRSGYSGTTKNLTFADITAIVKDATFEMSRNVTSDGGVLSMITATNGAQVIVRGNIRLAGNPLVAPNVPPGSAFYSSGPGSSIAIGVNNEADCNVSVDFAAGSSLIYLGAAAAGGRLVQLTSRIDVRRNLTVTGGVFSASNGSSFAVNTAYVNGLAYERPTFVGPGRFVTPHSIRLSGLSVYEHYGPRWPVGAADFWTRSNLDRVSGQHTIRIDKASYFGGRYGLDVTNDARFTSV